MYEKAIDAGLELEKIPFDTTNWREHIGRILDFYGTLREQFPEEARKLRRKIQKAQEYLETLEKNIIVLVAMGCFAPEPSNFFVNEYGAKQYTLTQGPTVFLCPERIRKCSNALVYVQGFKDWIESLENPLHQPSPKKFADDVEHIYRFVTLHEHAHAATIPKDKIKQDVDIIRTMNEGIAQWITYEILKRANEQKTLSLFEDHARATPKEYRFYKQLNQIEKGYGFSAVISSILCWGHATDFYAWKEFVRHANQGIYKLYSV